MSSLRIRFARRVESLLIPSNSKKCLPIPRILFAPISVYTAARAQPIGERRDATAGTPANRSPHYGGMASRSLRDRRCGARRAGEGRSGVVRASLPPLRDRGLSLLLPP